MRDLIIAAAALLPMLRKPAPARDFAPPLMLPAPGLSPDPQPPAAVIPFERERVKRRQVNGHAAMLAFLAWMRDHGFDDWLSADEVDDAYRYFCEDEGLAEMPSNQMREMLAAMPGAMRVRQRLNAVADPAIMRAKRRLGGTTRAILYRVMSHAEFAETRRRRAPAKRAA